MDASSFTHGPLSPAAAGITGPFWSALQPVVAGVEAQSAFAAPDAASTLVPTFGGLDPYWSPYGSLVRPFRPPPHNLAAGALLFDETA